VKLTSSKGIRLGLVAGLVATGLVGVTSLTAAGQTSPRTEDAGTLVLTVAEGNARSGTVEYFGPGNTTGNADARQTLSALSACDTIVEDGADLLGISGTSTDGKPVLPGDGLGIITANQNCGSSGVIYRQEALSLSLDTFFDSGFPGPVSVSEAVLTVLRDETQDGNLTVVRDGGSMQTLDLGTQTGPITRTITGGFADALDISSTSPRFNKGLLLQSATFTLVATIPNQAPTADFSFTPDGLSVEFTDASSDTDGTIASWAWDFGDGSTSTSQDPLHTYATAGTYTVTLTVTDNDNEASAQVQKSVTVNQAPTASFSVVQDGLDVTFTDTSTDPDGDLITSWLWNFGDGTTSNQQNPPEYRYPAADTYTVTLTVTDEGGQSTSTQQIIVVNNDPIADFSFVPTLLDVQFTDASSDTDGTIETWAWDFGDSNTSTFQNPLHTYAATGTYDVTLTVMDDQGATKMETKTVEVLFDEAVFCLDPAVTQPGDTGDIATSAAFERLKNKGQSTTDDCEDVGVTIVIEEPSAAYPDGSVFWNNSFVGVGGSTQQVQAYFTIEWSPTADPAKLNRKIDYDADPTTGLGEDIRWCAGIDLVTGIPILPDYDGDGAIDFDPDPGAVDLRAPWCLVEDTRELQDDGKILQIQRLFGSGDPRMR